jgi:hypothetical protein
VKSRSEEILGDSSASGIIFNQLNEHLVTDKQPVEGSIIGANGTQLGAIVHKGFIEFMRVCMRCYVADITKSVVGIGYIVFASKSRANI